MPTTCSRQEPSGLGWVGIHPHPLGSLEPRLRTSLVLICASQLHLLLFSVGDRLPDVVVLLFVCLLNRCNIFSVISLFALCGQRSAWNPALFLLTLGRCRGAGPPQPRTGSLHHPGPPGAAFGRFYSRHWSHYSCLSLPSSWGLHLADWVCVPPPATKASGSDEMLPPRHACWELILWRPFHAMYPNKKKSLKVLKVAKLKKKKKITKKNANAPNRSLPLMRSIPCLFPDRRLRWQGVRSPANGPWPALARLPSTRENPGLGLAPAGPSWWLPLIDLSLSDSDLHQGRP